VAIGVNVATAAYKRQVPFTDSYNFYSNIAGEQCREVVIDYEFLRGRQNETVVNELCVASAAVFVTFRFKSPYKMAVSWLIRERPQ